MQSLLTRADHWRGHGEAVTAIQLACAAGELLGELGGWFELESWFVGELAGHLPPEESDSDGPQLVVLSQVHRLPAEIAAHVEPRYPLYRPDRSSTANRSYLMNHCPCRAKLGDYFLHQQPGGAFCPTSEEEVARVIFRELAIAGSFEFEAWFLGGFEVLGGEIP